MIARSAHQRPPRLSEEARNAARINAHAYFRQTQYVCIRRSIIADVFWYSRVSPRGAGEQPRARPIPGPAGSWAGFFSVAAKILELGLSGDCEGRAKTTSADAQPEDRRQMLVAASIIIALATPRPCSKTRFFCAFAAPKTCLFVSQCLPNVCLTSTFCAARRCVIAFNLFAME